MMALLKTGLGFATSALGGVWGYVAAAALAGIICSAATYSVKNAYDQNTIKTLKLADAHSKLVAMNEVLVHTERADKITYDLGIAHQAAWDKEHAITLTIIKKVYLHVTPKIDRLFPVPCGLVRVYNAAVAGTDPAEIPLPAGKADDSACPVTASALSAVLVGNTGLARERGEDLAAWREWYTEQKAAYDAGVPKAAGL